ncbi:MAG: hypothetical protein CUN55_08685, partial [Phototrophicales bacterium]
MKIIQNILNTIVNAIGGPSMLKFLVRRTLAAIPVLFAIMVVTFGLTRIMPGGPFDAVGQRSMPAHIRAQLEERYGLNKALFFDTPSNANGAEVQWGKQAYAKGGFGEDVSGVYAELDNTGVRFRGTYNLIVWDDEAERLVEYERNPFKNWVEENSDLVYTVNTLSTLSTSSLSMPTGIGGVANYMTATGVTNHSLQELAEYNEDCRPYKQYPGWAVLATREECKTSSGNVSFVVNRSKDVFRIDALDSQFWNYVWGVLHFDFGPSLNIADRESLQVRDEILLRLPVSMEVGVIAVIFGFSLGIPLGVLAAIYHNTFIDFIATFFAVLGQSTPNIVLAPILIIIVALELQWLPVPDGSGWKDPFFSRTHLENLILPTIALGTGMSASIARLTRASLLQVLNEDYIRTARAKGLRERTVIYLHGLKNSLIPVATILGPLLAGILTGTFIIELIFVIPGLGETFITSVGARDYTMIMAVTLLYSVFLIIGNIMVDVIYTWLD